MRIVKQPGAPPEHLWRLVKSEVPRPCNLALRLMAMGINAADCERIFSQMGLTAVMFEADGTGSVQYPNGNLWMSFTAETGKRALYSHADQVSLHSAHAHPRSPTTY